MERLFECLPVKYIILLLVVSADTYLHRCLCSSPSCLSRGCTLTSTLSMQPGFPLQTVVFFSCLSLPPSYDSSCKHSAMYSYSYVDSESSGKSFGRLILSPFAAQTLRERRERRERERATCQHEYSTFFQVLLFPGSLAVYRCISPTCSVDS